MGQTSRIINDLSPLEIDIPSQNIIYRERTLYRGVAYIILKEQLSFITAQHCWEEEEKERLMFDFWCERDYIYTDASRKSINFTPVVAEERKRTHTQCEVYSIDVLLWRNNWALANAIKLFSKCQPRSLCNIYPQLKNKSDSPRCGWAVCEEGSSSALSLLYYLTCVCAFVRSLTNILSTNHNKVKSERCL